MNKIVHIWTQAIVLANQNLNNKTLDVEERVIRTINILYNSCQLIIDNLKYKKLDFINFFEKYHNIEQRFMNLKQPRNIYDKYCLLKMFLDSYSYSFDLKEACRDKALCIDYLRIFIASTYEILVQLVESNDLILKFY